MREPVNVFWEKAEENLEAAQSEFISNRYNSSASRCYYACFHAAVYALGQAGIRPSRDQWSHNFVQGGFNRQFLIRRKLYPADLRTTLDQNRALRLVADYGSDHVTEVRADRAVARTERFLETIRPGGGETA